MSSLCEVKISSGTAGMESLIRVINELQQVFHLTRAHSIQLPQIIVVGAQSSGKSSVLESLVGKPFLPRGSGLVTRCPIILRLIHTEEKHDNGAEEWCTFVHLNDEVFVDYDKVRQEIEDETVRMAGKNQNIVDKPIILTVYSPRLLTLTVVDLPGIVKVPQGDQPENIESQIQELIMKYITNPNSVILAVNPANNDIANADGIKFAKKVDPEGDRTLAIITKLDLMDRGVDAHDILTGSIINVKRGIIGVVNRSQEDINNKKSIENSLEYEKQFLERHYPTLASTHGTPYLARTLSQMLMTHINKCLPEIEKRICTLKDQYEVKFEKLGGRTLQKDKDNLMVGIINKFCDDYVIQMDGNSKDSKIIIDKMSGGAFIRKLCKKELKDNFAPLLSQRFDDKTIRNAIKNAKGFEGNLQYKDAFIGLVKLQIQKIKEPVIKSADTVLNLLKAIVDGYIFKNTELQRFPNLRQGVSDIVNEIWNHAFQTFKAKLLEFIEREADFVDADDEEFMEEIEVFKIDFKSETNRLNKKLTDEEIMEKYCKKTNQLIIIYFQIILRNLKHEFRSGLAHYVIYHAKRHINSKLITELHVPDKIDKLMEETAVNKLERESTMKMLEELQNATKIIERMRCTVP